MYVPFHYSQILTQVECSRQISEKQTNIKLHINRPARAELFYVGVQTHKETVGQTDRQTDRREESNSPYTQFFGKPLKMPDVTYISKSDNTMSGFKAGKYSLTILFGE